MVTVVVWLWVVTGGKRRGLYVWYSLPSLLPSLCPSLGRVVIPHVSSELTSELASEPRKSGYPSCILRAYFRACVRASEKCVRASEEWLSLIYRPSLLPSLRPSLGKVRPSLGRGSDPHISSEARIRGSERLGEARKPRLGGFPRLGEARKPYPGLGNSFRGSDPSQVARIRGMSSD
jgi:hypothetical protein